MCLFVSVSVSVRLCLQLAIVDVVLFMKVDAVSWATGRRARTWVASSAAAAATGAMPRVSQHDIVRVCHGSWMMHTIFTATAVLIIRMSTTNTGIVSGMLMTTQ